MTALAVALAVLGAGCFAGAAALQHGAVHAVAGGAGLRGGALRDLVARRGWLGGLALAGAGTALHGTALVLAPLSVVQPVGVLAVPMAVAVTALRAGRRPRAGVRAGVAATVGGVALFVALAAAGAAPGPVPAAAAALAAVAAALPVAALAAVAATTAGRVRCVAAATAGAVAFGLVAALVRALAQQLGGVPGPAGATVLATGAGIAVALALGGWLVQQGFAAGPPEVVVACLTVVDPIVAVLLGVLLLGERAGGPAVLLALAALVAAAGVLGLARHVPRAAPAPDPRPGRPAPVPARSVQGGPS